MSIGTPVIIGAYTITLEEINNSVSGQQTWTYKVALTGDSSGGGEISHWNLELCVNHNVINVSKNGVVVPTADADTLDIVIENPNGNYCYTIPVDLNIKWDDLSNAEVFPAAEGTFDFTLQGQYGTREVELNIKGGNALPCTAAKILGPSCELSRGYDFSKLVDLEFTEEEI